MASRRRNLFVILFVVAMTIGSLLIIASKPTRLGLDLRGGTQLIYQGQPTPEVPQPAAEDIDRAIEIIRERVDELGVSEPEISRVGEDQLEVGLPDVQNAERAIEQVGETAQLHLYDWEENVIIPPQRAEGELPVSPPQWDARTQIPRLYDAVTVAAKQKPECVDENCTTAGPQYYLFDRNHNLLAGPEPRREDLFLEFDERQPKGSEVITAPQGTLVLGEEREGATPAAGESAPSIYYVIHDRPALSGDDLKDPEQNFDPTTNQPNVTFDFTDEGRRAFEEVTRKIAQRGLANTPLGAPGANFAGRFAIVLDDEIVSRPIIDPDENPDGIDGRTGAQISGNFTIQEAQDLATFLQIGALPVELKLISTSTVSATLGQEALDQGLRAGLAGLILVLLFLIFYYRFLGVVAALGLLVYAAFFYALMELIPITLTLPGIAGLILTIGVAADSNVVIFERIKEEAWAGKSMRSAIATGYRRGIATIIDANVITLLTAFILFVLATAGVKGFAFTLGVGTIVSLFTAVVFTQAVLGTLGRSRILRSPAFLGAGEQRVRWHFDFAAASRWFFSVSGLILLVGGLSFATAQLNFGIDFESGTRVKVSLEEAPDVDQLRESLAAAGVEGADAAEIQQVDPEDEGSEFGENVFQIQTAQLEPESVGQLQAHLDDEFGVTEEGFDSTSVGPTFGEQIARSALYALAFSLILIAAYVAFRFEAKYAIPVLIAVIHDILITAGVYSLADREVSSATVAAFLTILGYSLYDTVIVFDRIRENVPRLPRAAFSQVANRSLSEILTRSLITGLSTVFLVSVILFFGGDTLKDFAFAMLVGLISGTYSSIFIATPVLIAWKEREPSYRARRNRIFEAMGRVPAFPEDNEVAKIEQAELHRAVPAVEAAAAAEPVPGAEPARDVAPSGPSQGVAVPSPAKAPAPVAEDEPAAPEPAAPVEPATPKPKRQKRGGKRKHGRRR